MASDGFFYHPSFFSQYWNHAWSCKYRHFPHI